MTAITERASWRLAAPSLDPLPPADTGRDDPCIVAFTSGTTGVPKGCVQFHRDVLAPCDTFAKHLVGPKPGDVFLTSAPMAFTFGLGITPMFPWRFGAAAATIEQGGPELMLDADCEIRSHPPRHRADRLQGDAVATRRSMQPSKTLRYCISAGEHLPEATWRAWKERTGIAITDGIGSTEMMHIFVSAAGDDIRPGATGKAVPGYIATVLDEDGNPMDEGVGRLAIKGPTGCRYLDDPRQRDYVQNGWNVTGDTYRRDADGYYWYLARNDDMIVSSGYNIGAPEVENALLSHPAVAECAVIGVPCPERGQKVKAFVVLGGGCGRLGRAGRRAAGARQGADRPLQISARDRVRRRAAEDRDGQAQAERVEESMIYANKDPKDADCRLQMAISHRPV